MMLLRTRGVVVAFLFNLCLVTGKDLLLPKCVKIISINAPVDDPTRATENYGLHAEKKGVVLSAKPGIFKVHRGLLKENGTVSLEAVFHPKHFLRHKNYKFHLEKELNNSMFFKDATFFILKVTENPALYAFELYSHPTWFMRHLKHKPYKVVLSKVNESSKEVMDSTFYLSPHDCPSKKKKHDSTVEKKTVLVGGGTFIDTADEQDDEFDVQNARANDLHAEDFDKSFSTKDSDDLGDTIRIHTEDEQRNSDKGPIEIHTESDEKLTKPDSDSDKGSDNSSDDIVKEVEEAFKISQNVNNSSYLEKIEKDIQDKVDAIAAVTTDNPKNQTEDTKTAHKELSNDKPVDNIEIHTETETETPVKPKESQKSKFSKLNNKERRVEVMDPVVKTSTEKDKVSQHQTVKTEFNKDIVITGRPKLSGNVVIESTMKYKHPQNAAPKGKSANIENVTGYDINDVAGMKTHVNATPSNITITVPEHISQSKAYQNYAQAHKILSKNIQNLKDVLNAIEGVPANSTTGNKPGTVTMKTNDGTMGSKTSLTGNDEALKIVKVSGTPIGPSNTNHKVPAGYKVLKTTSTTETTITKLPGPLYAQVHKASAKSATNQSVVSGASVKAHAQPVHAVSFPGLHVVQGYGHQMPTDVSAQGSADIVDHIASELVDHNRQQSHAHSHSDLLHMPRPQNQSLLQETFKELTPDNTKIFYLGQCEDKFPKACEQWAAKRFCLTFGELMKRYCRKACKLCNHVLTTGFTQCDKTCGGGIRLRMIKVNNRQVLQRRSCNVHSCPVNGGYTPYSEWSECSVTCGEGVRYRHRSCTNPKPQFGGHDCSHFGPPVDTMPCVKGCKGFNPARHNSKADPDNYPEYKAEESNPTILEAVGESESGANSGDEDSGEHPAKGEDHEFEWPSKHHRQKPLILHHVHKNIYQHRDDHGKTHYLDVDEEQSPDDEFQTHVVRYHGQEVAKMQCGPSRLLQYQRNPPNVPVAGYKRSNTFKMYEDGQLMYDKEGLPTDTTKNIVEAFDSPYKIILQRNKNNQMKVLEQCIESDASVNPDNELKDDAQSFAGTTSLGSEQHPLPASTRMNTERTTSNRFTENGLYEYKYQDIGEGVDDPPKTLGKDVTDQLSRVIKKETAGIAQRFLRNQDPKPTLNEELAEEKAEELREKKYEDALAKRSKPLTGNLSL